MSASDIAQSKRARRSYTDEQIADALAKLEANNGNIYLTAKQEGLPYHTLREWAVNRRRSSPTVEALQQVKVGTLEDKLQQIAHLSLDRLLDPTVIAKASPLDCAKIAGITIDKGLVLSASAAVPGVHVDRQELSITLTIALGELDSEDDPLQRARNVTPTGPERPQDVGFFQG